MSNDNQFARLFKLWASVSRLVLDGKRSAKRVADLLQKVVEEKQSKFTLYLSKKQREGGLISGFDLEADLKKNDLLEITVSLEHEVVKNWIADPSTYPEEYKGKAIFLWKSQQDVGRSRVVAYLIWSGERVIVRWGWLERVWDGSNPVLLANS